jgi:hypothetical protein
MSQSAKPSKRSSVILKRKDNPQPLLIAGAVALVAAGAGTAVWFFTRPPLEKILPTGYQVLPPQTLMTLSVPSDPAQWQSLRSLGTTQSRTLFDKTLAEWRDRLLGAEDLDYGRDIQPWVGSEITFALLPQGEVAGSSAQMPLVVVVPVANPVQAVQSLRTSQDRGGAAWTERDYQGFKLRERQGRDGQRVAVTIVDNQFLVAAFTPKALEQVVDAIKDGVTLKDIPGYQSAWGAIQDAKAKSFANVFVNVPMTAHRIADKPASPVKPDDFARTQQNQGFVLSAALGESNVSIQGVSWLKPDGRRLAVYNNARLMPTLLPASTYMFLSGGNLKQTWQDYDAGAETNTLAPLPPARLRDGLKNWAGLDFDQDVLAWMGGEYAIAFIAAPDTKTNQSGGTGISVLAQASDRRLAEQFFQKLDQAVTSRYQFQVQAQTIQNQAVTTWVDKNNRAIATHGWLENNVAFLTAGAPVSESFVPKPAQPLATTESFTQGIPTGLSPNNGHFFLDVTKTIKNPMPNLPFLPSGNPLVQAIESIGVTAAVRDEKSTRFDLNIKLKKEGTVPAFPAPGATPP